MRTRSIAALALGFATTCSAPAYACPTWHTLTNGTPADANQVMDNFNAILQCPDFTGNVGIGTSTPGATLDINGYVWTDGPQASYGFFDRTNGGNAWAWYSNGNTAYFWKNFNTAGNVVSVDQNGNVGIGTSTPDTYKRLTLDKTTGDGNYGGISFRAAGAYVGQIEQEGSGNIYYDALADMYLRPGNSATAMVLKANGSIGIGTTSPSYTLHVNGSVAGTSAYNNLSDARLKKDVGTISDALTTVEKLRGVRFKWRMPQERTVGKTLDLPGNKTQIGFIAQEVSKVVPEAVTVAGGQDAIMSMQESKIVPLLVEAIKELDASNKELKREVAELRGEHRNLASDSGILDRVAFALGW